MDNIAEPRNILLIVVDCLRLDHVTKEHMPWLSNFAANNISYSQFWSTSHSTDPAMTSLLTGLWPDELGLYAMMAEDQSYMVSPLVDDRIITRLAGFTMDTGVVTNLGRWYTIGANYYENVGALPDPKLACAAALDMLHRLKSPWFMFMHDVSCHTPYRDGSYDQACRTLDWDLQQLVSPYENDGKTNIIITADHGEALGQYGIEQHGYGVWPVLTHIPLIIHIPQPEVRLIHKMWQHIDVYHYMINLFWGVYYFGDDRRYANIVGRVPSVWHRGITDGKTMLFKEQWQDGDTIFRLIDARDGHELPLDMSLWKHAKEHAALFGINADNGLCDERDDAVIAERLKALGYYG